jgi:hypothetical protein
VACQLAIEEVRPSRDGPPQMPCRALVDRDAVELADVAGVAAPGPERGAAAIWLIGVPTRWNVSVPPGPRHFTATPRFWQLWLPSGRATRMPLPTASVGLPLPSPPRTGISTSSERTASTSPRGYERGYSAQREGPSGRSEGPHSCSEGWLARKDSNLQSPDPESSRPQRRATTLGRWT